MVASPWLRQRRIMRADMDSCLKTTSRLFGIAGDTVLIPGGLAMFTARNGRAARLRRGLGLRASSWLFEWLQIPFQALATVGN